jgi:hypothetical protein
MKRLVLLTATTIILSCSSELINEESTTPTQYTLTVIVKEGGIVTPEATGIYSEGAQLTLSAIPDEGYIFCRWLGTDNDSEGCLQQNLVGGAAAGGARGGARCIIKMNSNREIQAFFEIIPD